MKIGITYRLFSVILAATVLAVVSMFLIMQWSIDRGFFRYVSNLEQQRLARLTERLEESYAARGNWDLLRNNPAYWRQLVITSMSEDGAFAGKPERAQTRQDPDASADGKFHKQPAPPLPRRRRMHILLLDSLRKPVIGPIEIPANINLTALHYRRQVVGYLGVIPHKHLYDVYELRFIKQQKLSLALVAMVVVLLAAGLSLPVANRLVRPIRALMTATNRMAAGHFDVRVPVDSSDELGQLARDYNVLALTLERNERARRQWVADISHELRTPLAVLQAEIEAIQDGIRPFTPDSIRSLHGEVLRISRLVDDLYQLSMSDIGALTYRKENLDLVDLVDESLAPYRQEFPRKGIEVDVDIPPGTSAPVFGDPERLHQLFANLFDNALKYTNPGGRLVIRFSLGNNQAVIDLQDSAPGVPESELSMLFDRLYRVEASRNRTAGGAGLGLAICRNIAEAHTGTIEARPSPLGGVWIRITLPLSEKC